jgi:hypothetical protein
MLLWVKKSYQTTGRSQRSHSHISVLAIPPLLSETEPFPIACTPVLEIRIRMFLGFLAPDPLVRGTDPDHFIHQAKIRRITLIPTVLWFLYDFRKICLFKQEGRSSQTQKIILLLMDPDIFSVRTRASGAAAGIWTAPATLSPPWTSCPTAHPASR